MIESADIIAPAGLENISCSLQQQPAQVALLCGRSGTFPTGLLAASATGKPFAVIDGAVRFNSYTLSQIARVLGIVPKTLLRRTHVTRSFTAFQTEETITGKLPRFLRATPSCRLVVILGLLDTYYDEQVKLRECRQSIRRVMETLRLLARAGVHFLIVDGEVANAEAGKECLFPMVRNSVDVIITIDANGLLLQPAAGQIEQQRRVQSWAETTIPSRSSSTPAAIRGENSAGR